MFSLLKIRRVIDFGVELEWEGKVYDQKRVFFLYRINFLEKIIGVRGFFRGYFYYLLKFW